MTPELYLSLMTMHGTLMVFFVLSVAPQNAFGHYILPMQIGAQDMAFPSARQPFVLADGCFVPDPAGRFFVPGGAPLSGWTAYPPLSAVGAIAGPGKGSGKRCGSSASPYSASHPRSARSTSSRRSSSSGATGLRLIRFP